MQIPKHFLFAVFAMTAAPELPASEEVNLHVMLQGESAAEMRWLAEQNGGKLTHFLPIINAVGAHMTRAQLDAALNSGKVTRVIDDLALDDQPEQEPVANQQCKAAGSVEILRHRDGFTWPLFSKSDESSKLTGLELRWPAALGQISSIQLGERKLPEELWQGSQENSASIQIKPAASPEFLGRMDLQVRFEHQLDEAPLQSAYTATASFGENCESKLIPGYPENSDDFYYATVTGADDLHRHGVTGRGITVAVLDSGLWDHPALVHDTDGKNRVLARYDAINDSDKDGVFDESGHGTHLTSVIAHSGPTRARGQATGSFKGIAPDASIVAIKAFNNEGRGDLLDIVRGVQWVVDNRERYAIRVLNLSFAARPKWPYYLDPINQAIMRAWATGITVIAAAGNEGPGDMTIGSPGNLPYIITVGATTDSWTTDTRADDYIPDFSSRGPTPEAHIKPDIVAPGGHITGVTRPGSTLTTQHPDYALPGGELVMTGSSQAAAVVSGLAALLLQLEPDLTPDDIKCKLLNTAEPAINRDGLLAYSPFVQGSGQVSLTRAITLGTRGCGNVGLNIARDIALEEHFEGPAILDAEGKVSLPGLTEMLSPESPAKGASESRVWGVKAHIERLPETYIDPPGHPFPWQEMYSAERKRIEELARQR